jgi:signal peptidase I
VKDVDEQLGNYEKQQKISKKNSDDFHPEKYRCFPHDDRYGWNIKNFGPLYLPRKDDTMPLDTMNIALYKNLIVYETGQDISIVQGHVLLNDSLITAYTFRKNYYFMAGDHAPDSRDSRYWGLLPEDHIVGKVALIRQSKDKKTGKRRWERFLRTIN